MSVIQDKRSNYDTDIFIPIFDAIREVVYKFIFFGTHVKIVTGLQTSCYKSVQKLSTSCVRTACFQLL